MPPASDTSSCRGEWLRVEGTNPLLKANINHILDVGASPAHSQYYSVYITLINRKITPHNTDNDTMKSLLTLYHDRSQRVMFERDVIVPL